MYSVDDVGHNFHGEWIVEVKEIVRVVVLK